MLGVTLVQYLVFTTSEAGVPTATSEKTATALLFNEADRTALMAVAFYMVEPDNEEWRDACLRLDPSLLRELLQSGAINEGKPIVQIGSVTVRAYNLTSIGYAALAAGLVNPDLFAQLQSLLGSPAPATQLQVD